MVIKNEVMFPGGAYKKMSYTEEDREVSYCNNDTFCHSNGSSSMQMVRPASHSHHHHVPEKHHGGHHLFGGNHHESHGLRHHGNGGHVNEAVEEKVKIFSEQKVLSGGGHREGYGSETHFASHAVREPYYYRNTETLKYSGTPNGRTHHFEFKGLDD